MKVLMKSLIETVVFFILFTLVVFLFGDEMDWKIIIIGTIINFDFNILLNWMSAKRGK